jgi:two-component system, OmpR family, sensor histidine kinase VicK
VARVKKLQGEDLFLQAIFKRSLEAIIILDRQNHLVEVNSSACELLGVTREESIGQLIDHFFTSTFDLAQDAKQESPQNIIEVQIRHPEGTIKTVEYSRVEELIPNYSLLVLRDVSSLKRAEVELDRQHQRVKLFAEVTLKIRDSLQLKEILQTTVNEVQKILQADRVLIYQVLEDGTGKPISEAVVPEYPPILGIEFPEEVFPEDYRELYGSGRVRAIDDVRSTEVGLAECLIEFMDEWTVKAKLVVPILQNRQSQTRLWGLLIAHQCKTTRTWTDFELELMQQLADQIGIALSQAELLENLEGIVAERTAKLRQEIDDRLQVEAALRRSEEQLRLIANGLPVLIAYVDKQQCYRFNNESYRGWLGLAPDRIYGCHLETVHDSAEYSTMRPHIKTALGGETVTYERDLTFIDGLVHSLSITYIPHTEDGKKTILGFFALSSDISERKAIERMKDEFISVVSHELRTPLTSIHSSLKILATGRLGNLSDKGERMLTIADEQTERLVRLVNNVLDLQSLQSGKVQMKQKACQVSELTIEAVQTMQTMAQEHGISLYTEAVAFVVWADRDYIVQTLTNLLSNAIKFSPSNSNVWVSAKRERQVKKGKKNISSSVTPISYITFSVKDRGQGIPDDRLETIFERFQQVDSSDSRKKGGTGLGLAICRQIVEEHGGKIWVESCLGSGSTFYFTLPEFKDRVL